MTCISQENIKAMAGDVRLAALRVVDQFVSHVQAGGDDNINILDWMSKATFVASQLTVFLY